MDEHIFDKIQDVDLQKTMETSYIDYAMSVIASRALPDVRDGLKPVQRRILFSMIELNNGPDKPHRKCARIVGDTMGKYHPHGDTSIYGSLVNMAQEWSTRYPLVDGHGNFGSVDGDGAAAMRYTEARLSKISMELTADINKDTVDFVPNFDETEKEPSVLPARFPNLLVNGTSGIAVGMATNIPPHNLRETIGAVVKIIDNRIGEDRETDVEELMEIIQGPDFPTGAEIVGRRGIEDAYRTGKGKIKVRAVSTIEQLPNGKSEIIVTELPFMVNKARLVKNISDLVKDKKIEGISDLSDQSSREGMRIVIEVKKDANANVVLNKLYKHTQMQDTFGVNMLALKNNEPKVMNLLEMMTCYLEHQEDVVTRRCRYELNKAQERAHILEGLLVALDHIDEIIRLIRASRTTAEAKANLIEAYAFSDAQAQAIVDMRLKALTGLEREKLQEEYDQLKETIDRLTAILGDEKLLLGLIRSELLDISERYGDERRTVIGYDEDEISLEDLIPEENVVITMTKVGYVKRMNVDTFRSQNRGGRGIKGSQLIDEDYVARLFTTLTHDYILFLTNKGRMYRRKAYEIPEAGRNARGMALINLLDLQPGECVTAIIPTGFEKDSSKYLFMATKKGLVKKTLISEFDNIRRTGIIAITLREDDELIDVWNTDGNRDIILVTAGGMSIRFNESDVRSTGRSSMGVRGISLNKDDEVIGMQKTGEGGYILFVSELGMGKRTRMEEFKNQNRGGKGVKCYNITPKTGRLVASMSVEEAGDMMIVTTAGVIIRIPYGDIGILGRITSGVHLIRLDENVRVASVTLVPETAVSESGEPEPEIISSGSDEQEPETMDSESGEQEDGNRDLTE